MNNSPRTWTPRLSWWMGIGIVFGAFIGVLLHNVALGAIIGLIIGSSIGALQWRKSA